MVSRYEPTEPTETRTAAYVVNRPAARVPYTRTVETKHATGQRVEGTVVSEEHPGAPARHYPVPTLEQENERLNENLQRQIRERFEGLPTFFCGRLSTYTYIDQDQAIERAFVCADEVERELRSGRAQNE
jgi:UDP-galactopyranose mutase